MYFIRKQMDGILKYRQDFIELSYKFDIRFLFLFSWLIAVFMPNTVLFNETTIKHST